MARQSAPPRMRARTEEYLSLHSSNPAQYPITIEAVAEFVPCSRTLFYKTDPLVREIVTMIEDARYRADLGGTAPKAEHGIAPRATAPRTVPSLERDIADVLARAEWAMKKYLGRRKEGRGPADAPLAAYDLDEAIAALLHQQSRIVPLLEEYTLQRGSTSTEVRCTPDLFDSV